MRGVRAIFGLGLAAAVATTAPPVAATDTAGQQQHRALSCFPGAAAVSNAGSDGWTPITLPLNVLSVVGVTAYDKPVPVRVIYAGAGVGLQPGFTEVVKATRDDDGRWRAVVAVVPPAWQVEDGAATVHRKTGHLAPEQGRALDRLAADQCIAATPTQPAGPHCRDDDAGWLEVRTPASAWTGRVGCIDLGAADQIAALLSRYGPAVAPGS